MNGWRPNSPTTNDPKPFLSICLRANDSAYQWLLRRFNGINPGVDPEATLVWARRAAQFACTFHSGRFADGALENVAFEIGRRLERVRSAASNYRLTARGPAHRRHILHVVTCAPSVAGHTRMLAHWVRRDESSQHSLVVLDTGELQPPSWLSDAVSASGGGFVVLERSPLLTRAQHLRALARQDVDLVILHHHSWDPVPTVALATTDSPPVALLNHADHEFWLGSSVADAVINLRSAGASHTMTRRFVSVNALLPVPLTAPAGGISRAEARRALGIGDSDLVLLTVGRGEKYRPNGPFDFFATASCILNRCAESQLYVVGETSAGIAPYLRSPIHNRIRMVGAIEDAAAYRAAADVYLESFPFGSQTALLEACLAGLPVVPAYAPLFCLLVANDDAVLDLTPNPPTEADYVGRADELLRQPGERARMGEALRARLMQSHVGGSWNSHLQRVYARTDVLTHKPRPIPTSPFLDTDADLGLSLRNVFIDGKTRPFAGPDALYDALFHASNVAKMVGDDRRGRRYALDSLLRHPLRWGAWRLMFASLLGRFGTLVRRGQVGYWQ